jgi:ubiquinone/menaquinone biosynthesis C-methylase UbiE
MAAAYDTYDYPAYWKDRDYEHKSEIIAIKSFLEKIDKIDTAVEIGVGFGRLVPDYIFRTNKLILTDPSARLLKLAKKHLHKKYSDKKIKFIQAKMENLPGKIKANSVDLVLLVRVLHHIEDVDEAFKVVRKILKKNGYFILEFANKRHLKATLTEFVHGNTTFLLDIFPKDLRSKQAKKTCCLPFNNYHPDIIKQKLIDNGFELFETRSVSNFRLPLIKRFIPKNILLEVESALQRFLKRLNFGPSIFILARYNG